jgi:FMN phosphatase YigB (HAD superfamily)
MLFALLLDLGDTLVQDDHVIDHVPQALAALALLRTGRGTPLELALVSDYTMPPPHAPASKVQHLFDEYVALLDGFGLKATFEPVEKRVTLSTQAGIRKPDSAIFRLALERLGLAPDLGTAMFITENAAHVAAARSLGMIAWQYGVDFTDWRTAPELVADALADDIAAAGPPPDAAAEERFRKALEDNQAIAPSGQPLGPGQTHTLEKGPDGKPRPQRRRFSMK